MTSYLRVTTAMNPNASRWTRFVDCLLLLPLVLGPSVDRGQPFWVQFKYRIRLALLVTASNVLKLLAPTVTFVHRLSITLTPLCRGRLYGIPLPDMARTARYRQYCPPVNHG